MKTHHVYAKAIYQLAAVPQTMPPGDIKLMGWGAAGPPRWNAVYAADHPQKERIALYP
jgi:hypothetical protein